MHPGYIHSVRIDSAFHRMDARWKLSAVVLSIIAVLLLPTVLAAATAFIGALALLLWSQLPIGWYLRRLAGVAVFLSLVLILLPLTMPGTMVAVGPVSISYDGLMLAVKICLKALTIVALVLLLLATGTLDQTLKAAHALHVPGLLIQLLMLTDRYALLFVDELRRLRVALRQRGFRQRASWHTYRTLGHTTGTLLVRSYERAERVGHALRCRAFGGKFRTLHAFQTCWTDVVQFGCMIALSALVPWGVYGLVE